jgi:hypothetical protein
VSKVAILMTTGALHPDHAVAFRSSGYRRLVSDHLHALRRDVAVRMAIDTTGMEQHAAGL